MALKITDVCVNCDGEPGFAAGCGEAHPAPVSGQPWMAGPRAHHGWLCARVEWE
ncbi:MAG TPA: hypothetical protein VND63_02000 [Rhodanobacteraceae bacterium]|nr:hypothetical protein [Rhodanobacteraceae bacterium]